MLKTFFLRRLRQIYYTEQQVVKSLPTLRNATCAQQVKDAVDNHKRVSLEQVKRLRMIFEIMRVPARVLNAPGVDGIIADIKKLVVPRKIDKSLVDIAVLNAVRQLQHYQIAAYRQMLPLAMLLRQRKILHWLTMSLEQENNADGLFEELLNKRSLVDAVTGE